MPLQSIRLRPGIDSQKPLLANEGGWSTSQLIRFKDGLPQAYGGWQKWWSGQFDSPARTILSWGDLNGIVYTAVATDTSLNVISQGTLTDITPLSQTSNPTPDFSTTTGSAVVTVLDNTHGALSGSYVTFPVPVSVGGLIISGEYQIASFPTSDTFTINAGSAATSTVADGGAVPSFTTTAGSTTVTVTLDNHGEVVGASFGVAVPVTVGGVTLEGSYLVQSVPDANTFTIDATAAATSAETVSENGGNARIIYYGVQAVSGSNYGYGIGGYGEGGYGQGSTYTPATLPTVPLWTMGNWGETLIVCPSGGAIFTWTPNSSETQAQLINTGPTVNDGIFIAMPQLTVVAWGSTAGGVQEPLLVKWSTVGDYTQWTPTVTNQAGSQTMPSGSRVVGGLQGPQQALIWTDVDLYAMNYLGGYGNTELAWGFNKIADHCGLIAPRACCVLGDAVFWLSGAGDMSDNGPPSGGQFLVLSGGVEPIHCTVWDKLWQDLDWANVNKIIAAPNALFHEIAWFYPSLSGGTGECDSYVKYNVVERTWDYGKLGRTAWQDQSAVGNPLGGGSDMYVYQHEIGTSADGAPLNWSIGSGAVMIAEGNDMSFVDWVLPEFQWGLTNNAATNQPVNMTLAGFKYTTDPLPLTTSTRQFSAGGSGFATVRVRGRHLTFTFGGQGFARIGDVRFRFAPDGKY
ncbi:MAG TPA: hypothetical protein PLV07_07425 [Acidiphilium sp.]|nr:hypothetical protein [Acidiphilium sp.]